MWASAIGKAIWGFFSGLIDKIMGIRNVEKREEAESMAASAAARLASTEDAHDKENEIRNAMDAVKDEKPGGDDDVSNANDWNARQ